MAGAAGRRQPTARDADHDATVTDARPQIASTRVSSPADRLDPAEGGVEVLLRVVEAAAGRHHPQVGGAERRGRPRPARPSARVVVRACTAMPHSMPMVGRVAPGLGGVAPQPLEPPAPARPGGICGNQPSASRPMRRITFSTTWPTNEPIQIGMGRCTGIGLSPIRSRWCHGRRTSPAPRVHSRRSTSTCSSMRAPAVGEVLVQRLVLHPVAARRPTPRRRRPPVSRSSSAACLATSTVWRCGRIRMLVTSSSALGDRAEEAEQHERLVVRARRRCAPSRPGPGRGWPPTTCSADEQVVEAGPLDGLGEVLEEAGSLPRSGWLKRDAVAHGASITRRRR